MNESKLNSMHSEVASADVPDYGHPDAVALGLRIYTEEREMTAWQAVMAHKRILLYCLAPFLCTAVVGYDNVANGASIAMPAFLIYFGSFDPATQSLYVPSIWAALWTSMSGLAQALGSFLVGFLYDRFGRRLAATVAAVVSIAGVAVQFTATTPGSLLAGKMINGFAVGALVTTGSTYASEIAPLRLRGPIQSGLILFQIFMFMVGLGSLRAFIPDIRESAFRTVFAIQWVWAGVILLGFPFLPESPVFLVSKNRLQDASKSLARLYGADNNIEARLAYLNNTIQHEKQNDRTEVGGYMECFKGTDLRRTLSVIFVLISPNMCGAALLAQNIYFLFLAGLEPVHVFDIGIGGFGLGAVLIVGSWFWMERIGRRTLFISGSVISMVGLLIIGCLYYVSGIGAVWALAVIMNVLISLQVVTLSSTSWVIGAELSSYRLRGKTQALGLIAQTFTGWLTSFVVPYMYNIDSGNLGARTGFVWAATSFLFVIGSYFWVPETMGLSISEIDWLFGNKVSSRKFQERKSDAKVSEETELKVEHV